MEADLRAQQGAPRSRERDGDPSRAGTPDPRSARRPAGLTHSNAELGTYDVVIIGGGIAGLWTRSVLEQQGRTVALVEHRALGSAQTAASQGILHAGVKYALRGRATEASRAVAEVQHLWRTCLAGASHPDLRSVRVIGQAMHMWTTGPASKIAAWGASKAMRSGVRKLDEHPRPFAGAPKGLAVYEVEETLVDPPSLVAALAGVGTGPLVRAQTAALTAGDGWAAVESDAGRLVCRRVVLCAGTGNESLLRLAGVDPAPLAQRRPLHMALIRGAPFELNGHSLQMSDVPRLTITSSRHRGEIIWYIGGRLAEDGVERSDDAQIEAAQREVRACLPWVDLHGAKWATLRIDRAEGKTSAGRRPSSVVVRELNAHLIVAWPTKLVLAPLAARRIADIVQSEPKLEHEPPEHEPPTVHVADLPWTSEGFTWK